MGSVCSRGTEKRNGEPHEVVHTRNSGNLKSDGKFESNRTDEISYTRIDEVDDSEKRPYSMFDSGELRQTTQPNTPASKARQVPSFLGKAGIVGLEKAVDVLDALGSSVANLNSGGFSTGVTTRGNKISILAFEVANTIAKGSNLLYSLSEESVSELKKDILTSEGVKRLVSTDMNELLLIAAADKREEFNVFSREVIRFGNLCKDPQWHNLDRLFSRWDSELDAHKQKREGIEASMQELTALAQRTSQLYHELHALDRFEQDYRRKVEEVDALNLPRKGECLTILQSELKHQGKVVRGMKNKSLWSKTVEQVVEKLVDIVGFIHQEIIDVFGDNRTLEQAKNITAKPERLGIAGLALHYANIITQIDNIASRPASVPPYTRDTLYSGLSPSLKSDLRSRLQLNPNPELSFTEIKAEMEKSLNWLVPLAAETTRAHQGFGWVGEWANTGNEFSKKTSTLSNLIRLQTLYHADKQKVEHCILHLLTCLHHLVSLARYRDNGAKTMPIRSPVSKPSTQRSGTSLSSNGEDKSHKNSVTISSEDRVLLEDVTKRKKLVPGLSKSQEFGKAKNIRSKIWALSRSAGSFPRRETMAERENVVDVLDVMDGLDSSFWAPNRSSR